MDKVLYYIIYPLFYLVSLLPLRVLYVISDFEYLIIYHLVGYRKKVVRKNLKSSFPDKSEAELKKIEQQFYHWLCDYFNETIKLLSISKETLLKHIEFRNVDQMEKCFSEGQNCAAILGHYCN
ncbi:MAG: acetyltransferase, partial [Prevotella sp.]|nr:acetyltransferase [Prevotella sp.]